MSAIILLTLTEGVKAAFLFTAAYVFMGGFRGRSFALVSGLSVLAGLGMGFFCPISEETRGFVITVFFALQTLFLFTGLMADRDLLGSRLLRAVFAVTLFFTPAAAVAFSVKATAVFSDEYVWGALSAIAGILAAAVAYNIFIKAFTRLRPSGAFSTRGLLVLLSSVNLLVTKGGEFSHLKFVLTVQAYAGRALEAAVGGVSAYFLVPRHEFVTTPLKGALDFLAGQELAMLITASILVAPPLAAAMGVMLKPEPDVQAIRVGAKRRKSLRTFRVDVLLKAALPIIALVLNAAMLHGANIDLNPLYEPRPRPLLATEGVLRVPVFGQDAIGDITDGKLRKFSVGAGEQSIVIIVMMRPDGEIRACLDACEICPPDGYGQKGDALVCKYCNTPIPVSSLGSPGGCNPIPVQSELDGDYLVINTKDLVSAFGEAGKKFGETH